MKFSNFLSLPKPFCERFSLTLIERSLCRLCNVLVRHKQSLRVSGWDRQTAAHEFMWFSKWNEILFKGTCNELATLRHPSSAVWCVLQWRIFLRESSPIVLHRVLRESKFWIRMHSQTMLVCIADDDFDFNRIQMNSHKTTWSILDASQQISKLDQLYALITKAASISFHSSVCSSVRSPMCSSVHSSTLSGSLSLSLSSHPLLSPSRLSAVAANRVCSVFVNTVARFHPLDSSVLTQYAHPVCVLTQCSPNTRCSHSSHLSGRARRCLFSLI